MHDRNVCASSRKDERESFDEEAYLWAYPDVAQAVRSGALLSGKDHYEQFGRLEGRDPLGLSLRQRAVFRYIDKNGVGLEIGPSHNPIAPKCRGFNVEVVDHASAEDLKVKYQGHNVALENIEKVDFIWCGECLSDLIGKKDHYDWIIASHVIEHIPDPVSFFQSCERLLKTSGVLSLVIPDKRYCFDQFSPLSTTGALLDSFFEKRTRPSHGQVFDAIANFSSRGGSIAWDRDAEGENKLVHTFEQAKSLLTKVCDSSAEYIDVHCWRFIPDAFRLIISDLNGLDLINLQIIADSDTVGCEFYVSLGKNSTRIESIERLSMLEKFLD